MNINAAVGQASDHWNRFYRSSSVPRVPSQFSAFVASEEPDSTAVVDFGCGNGRDALFFARHGKRVVGMDASKSAISECQRSADEQGLSATFLNADVLVDECAKLALGEIGGIEGRVVVYARFFLHAITLEAEEMLLTHAAKILEDRDGIFALEFRTSRDAHQTKVTPDHYRRFVDPVDFIVRASRHGLKSRYLVEGFGLAKYKDDDAHVARCILSRD